MPRLLQPYRANGCTVGSHQLPLLDIFCGKSGTATDSFHEERGAPPLEPTMDKTRRRDNPTWPLLLLRLLDKQEPW